MVLYGPDVSHFQSGINLAKAAAEGASFVIGKISQGSTYTDSQWPKTRDQGKAAGLLVCGYHYVDTSNADSQAATCARWIGDESIPVALDWEANGGNWSNLLNVLKAFRAAGLNVRLLYTGAWYWSQVGSPNMSGCGLVLWKSRYPTTNPGSPAALYAKVPASYWAPLGGLPTSLLQFTNHATIAGMSTDCSAFQGTRDEFAALLGTAPAPALEDDEMTDADRKLLQEVHFMLSQLIWPQIAGDGADPLSSDPAKMFPGWPPLAEKLPLEGRKTLVDWVRNQAFEG